MKRWAFQVTCAYLLLIIILTLPVGWLAFLGLKTQISGAETFRSWYYWFWVVGLVAGQYALLALPVQVTDKRPVTKRPVIYLVGASGMAIGLLCAGCIVSVGEVIMGEESFAYPLYLAALLTLILIWAGWAYIFYRKSAGLEPKTVIESQCRYLFTGSALELLIAVPAHIIVRQRGYCCAGVSTFFGIAFGLAVMIFSFGPGVFFLYAERMRRKDGGPAV